MMWEIKYLGHGCSPTSLLNPLEKVRISYEGHSVNPNPIFKPISSKTAFLCYVCLLSGIDQLWIGLHDTIMQMDFQWTDHTPVIFTYWHPFEPNNFRNTQEDCVSIWGLVSDHPHPHPHADPSPKPKDCQQFSSVCIYLTAVLSRFVCVLLACAGRPLGRQPL